MLIKSKSILLNGLIKSLTTLIVFTTILSLYVAFQYFDSQATSKHQERLVSHGESTVITFRD